MSDPCCEGSAAVAAGLRSKHRGVLRTVLAINLGLFAVEAGAGVLARSSALLGDSLDMLGDALIYGASLFVVDRSARDQARVAAGKGVLMALLAAVVIADAAAGIAARSVPTPAVVGAIGALALLGNAVCFALLYRHRGDNLNLRSTWLCSRNDLIANLAVLGSAVAVAALQSGWPDALVGGGLALLWLRSSFQVLRGSREVLRAPAPTADPEAIR